jgi:hypothetical protein
MIVRLKRCPKCGRTVPRDAFACSGCGAAFAFRASNRQLPPAVLPPGARWVAPPPHDISIAALASIFLVGMGQVYNGQMWKGALFLILALIVLTGALHFWSRPLFAAALLISAVSIVDAAMIAGHLREGETVRPNQWF